jgi:hypothetical protein
MPGLVRRLTAALLLRRLIRAVEALAGTQQAQTALLARLADRLAPAPVGSGPLPGPEAAGVTYLDADDQALALAYVERTRRHTGHTPDEDEVLSYLADEKTRDLATRLAEREAEQAERERARLGGMLDRSGEGR